MQAEVKNEKKIDIIKKMLALAENNPFPEESQNAMLKAQEFMLRYGISMSDIEFNNKNNKEVVEDCFIEKSRMPWYYKSLMVIIGKNFRCEPYISSCGAKTKAYFIGLIEDVELAKEVFTYATMSVEKYAKRYVENNKKLGSKTTGLKNDFILGFINGLRDKFKKQVDEGNYSLMLVKNDAVIEKVESKKLRKSQASSFTRSFNDSARQAGYNQGVNFNNQTGMITDY